MARFKNDMAPGLDSKNKHQAMVTVDVSLTATTSNALFYGRVKKRSAFHCTVRHTRLMLDKKVA